LSREDQFEDYFKENDAILHKADLQL
jgi:hypothetical protein